MLKQTEEEILKSEVVEDAFGFLPEKWSLKFDDFEIIPLDEYDKNKEYIKKYTHQDKFYYPPVTNSISVDPKTQEIKETIPNTERPAALYKIPNSHNILTQGVGLDQEKLRRGILGFILNLLGYYFGRRFQFDGWWYDSRVPMDNQHNIIMRKDECEDFLNHSVIEWKKWTSDKQKIFSNILFMHSRATSYQWDWERFMIEYMTFDGIWNVFSADTGIKSPHAQRINIILTHYKMPKDQTILTKFVKLRNDLFHETLWDKGQPCTGASQDAFYSFYYLQRMNDRLILALLKYPTKYIMTDWKYMGTCGFKS